MSFPCISYVSAQIKSFPYNDVNYESSQLALDAEKKDMDILLSKIDITKTPYGGSANIVLPSERYVKKYFPFLYKYYTPQKELTDVWDSFQASRTILSLQSKAQAVDKRKIFDKVVITMSDAPDSLSCNEDVALIVLNQDGEPQWFLKKKNQRASMMRGIEGISEAVPPVAQLLLWLENVEKSVRDTL